MAKLKQRSKRQTLHKKHAIEKKVRAHNRKMRKLAKEIPESRRLKKKDPGVPHLYPFKEELVRHYEQARERKLEEKREAKEARRAAKAGDA